MATLAPVVVTATRFLDSAATLPMGVSVLTAEDLAASGASTVNEALARLLGLVARQDLNGTGDPVLDLRGFGSTADNNQVIVIDGQRVSEADTGGTRLANLPLESIARIEVIRGGSAVLYGEGATAGVIVITTKAGDGQARKSGATAQLSGGSFGLREARATATLATGSITLDAAASERRSEGYRAYQRSSQDAQSLGLQWSGDWLRAGASIGQDRLDAQLPGALSRAAYDANPRQAGSYLDRVHMQNDRRTAFVQAELGAWQLAADMGLRHRQIRTDQASFDHDITARTHSLRARHEGSVFGLRNVLTLGIDRNQWERDLLPGPSTATQDARAFYAKDDVFLSGGTRLSAGLRTERMDKRAGGKQIEGNLTGSELGISHPLADGVTGFARIGRSYRLATADEFTYAPTGVLLQPQTSRDIELGSRWRHAAGTMEARLYRHDLRHEVGFDGAGLYRNVNFDPTLRQGLEVDATQKVSSTVQAQVHAAVRQSRFVEGSYNGRDVALAPKRSLALRGEWTPVAAHRLSGGVNWVSSQFVDFDNTCSVPSFAVADMRYTYRWQKLEASLGVNNLFDRKYFTQAFACSGSQATSLYPEAGRSFTGTLRVALWAP